MLGGLHQHPNVAPLVNLDAMRERLVAELGKGLVFGDRGSSLGAELAGSLLALEVSLALDLALLLETVDNVLVAPSNLVGDTLEGGVLASGLQAENTESSGDDHLLDLVLGGGDTLVEGETAESGGTTSRLVGDHSADSLEEDAGRSAVVEGTGLLGVDNVTLVEVGVVLELVTEERARDVDLLAADNRDLLAREDLMLAEVRGRE